MIATPIRKITISNEGHPWRRHSTISNYSQRLTGRTSPNPLRKPHPTTKRPLPPPPSLPHPSPLPRLYSPNWKPYPKGYSLRLVNILGIVHIPHGRISRSREVRRGLSGDWSGEAAGGSGYSGRAAAVLQNSTTGCSGRSNCLPCVNPSSREQSAVFPSGCRPNPEARAVTEVVSHHRVAARWSSSAASS